MDKKSMEPLSQPKGTEPTRAATSVKANSRGVPVRSRARSIDTVVEDERTAAMEAARRIIDYWGPDYGNEDEVIVATALLASEPAPRVGEALRILKWRAEQYRKLIEGGKGTHGQAGYVTDATWSAWSGALGAWEEAATRVAALASPPRDGWMPIDSAPRDKTMVALLHVAGNTHRYGVGWYMPMNGWQCWDSDGPHPTHWLPLPSPPRDGE